MLTITDLLIYVGIPVAYITLIVVGVDMSVRHMYTGHYTRKGAREYYRMLDNMTPAEEIFATIEREKAEREKNNA